jgi:hypothetical protein
MFADLALSRRLEHAEGVACRQFAEARRRLVPDSGAAWMECAGVCAVFDTVDSPVTQTFGLGIFEELNEETLDTLEGFFLGRGAPVAHEVSPFAGAAALELLCARNYRPIEISSVMYRAVERPRVEDRPRVRARPIRPEEAQLWNEISVRGWTCDHPELVDTLLEFGATLTARTGSSCFLAEFDGQPGAAGALCMDEGVALFAGAATVQEFRRRGLQAALLDERMRYAFDRGCDLAMMVAGTGSSSQRNAERRGFQIAYTRLKWRLGGSSR